MPATNHMESEKRERVNSCSHGSMTDRAKVEIRRRWCRQTWSWSVLSRWCFERFRVVDMVGSFWKYGAEGGVRFTLGIGPGCRSDVEQEVEGWWWM